ncbi:MAG: AAA family ATPase [Candidatus Lokiarchaeota archaeon]|nr:AAA family ATPase [Candidatus Lokiarchaeota archaeon]
MINKKRLEKIIGMNTDQIIESKILLDLIDQKINFKNLLPLNSTGFDDLLGGGFCPGKMYLVYGANKTGKTQLCHQLCLQAVKNGRKAYYLDTENTFRAERMVELARLQCFNPDDILKNIHISKIKSNSMLLLVISDIQHALNNKKDQVLVVDSINNYFRYERDAPNLTFSNVKQVFMRVLSKLQEITSKFNTVTVVTAQITPNFEIKPVLKELPVGNQYLNHFFSEYIYLRRLELGLNQARLINSQDLPERIINYKITQSGIDPFTP